MPFSSSFAPLNMLLVTYEKVKEVERENEGKRKRQREKVSVVRGDQRILTHHIYVRE